MKRRILAGALSVVAVLASTAPVHATDGSTGAFVPGTVLVRFREGVSARARARLLAAIHGRVERTIPLIGVDVVRVPARVPVARLVARARRDPAVDFAEPDSTGRVALNPNDTCVVGCGAAQRQWNLAAVNAPAGWDVVPGTFYRQRDKKALTPVKLAVLDTAIDVYRSDWVNAGADPVNAPWDAREGGQIDVADAKSYVPPANQAGPAWYHGTFVAGIAGAAADNEADIAGLGFGAQIMPVAVVDGTGKVAASNLAEGITSAWMNGARVINLSLVLDEWSDTVQRAIYSVSKPPSGALVVAAAGNTGKDDLVYPAAMTGVMAVGAVDEADRPGACSTHNESVSVVAPGVGLLSLDPRDQTTGRSVAGCGTSTAAPHVSALAAMLFAQDPSRTPGDVRSIIENSADDVDAERYLGRDDFYGRGRINVQRALLAGLALRDGLPPLPVVDRLRATIPAAAGGTSKVTAIVLPAGKHVTTAEWFLGAPGEPGTGGPVSVAEGTDATADPGALTMMIPVPGTMSTGVHRVYVRAKDADGWGAASVGALLVDRAPPTIDSLQATFAAPAAGIPSDISFGVGDDFSRSVTYSITVARDVAGLTQPVYRSEPKTIMVPGVEQVQWTPGLTDVGPYTLTLSVVDQGGNTATASTTLVVV